MFQRLQFCLLGCLNILKQSFIPAGLGTDSIERSSKGQVGLSDAHKHERKNTQEVIHWHNR